MCADVRACVRASYADRAAWCQALNWIMEHQDDPDIDAPHTAPTTTGTAAAPAATDAVPETTAAAAAKCMAWPEVLAGLGATPFSLKLRFLAL